MHSAIATCGYVLVSVGLFWLDRNSKVKTSGALWIPVIWVAIACSRPVSLWLQMGAASDSADQVLEGSPIDRMVYAGLLAIGIGVVVNRKQQVVKFLRANLVIVLFFVYCLVSLLWSDYPDVAFKRWIRIVGDLVMVMIVLTDREPLTAMKRLLARLSYTLLPLSIVFIKYFPELGRAYGIWEGEAYYVGVTANKNTLGVICLCFGLGAFWRLLAAYRGQETSGKARRMIAQLVILAMVFWLLHMANAMTSFSSFVMASTLLALANTRTVIRRPRIVHILIAAMFLVSASVLFLGFSPDALKTLGRNPTLTGRTEVWGNVLSLVRNPWLGTGFESFWLGPRLAKMWSLYWWHPNQAHNGYLEIFLNLGWVGAVLLGLVIVTGYRNVFNSWRNKAPMGSLRLAYFLVGLVFNFTEAAFFRMQAPAWLFFLLAISRFPDSDRKIQPTQKNLSQHPDVLDNTHNLSASHEPEPIKLEHIPS